MHAIPFLGAPGVPRTRRCGIHGLDPGPHRPALVVGQVTLCELSLRIALRDFCSGPSRAESRGRPRLEHLRAATRQTGFTVAPGPTRPEMLRSCEDRLQVDRGGNGESRDGDRDSPRPCLRQRAEQL